MVRQGIYHEVNKGETLWSIAKIYEVDIDTIIKSNKISNAALIEEGQLVFVQGVRDVKEVVVRQEDLNQKEFIWPVNGKVLSYFGSVTSGYLNKGISIHSKDGHKVRASRRGKIVLADYLSGYFNTVIVDHLDGYSSVYSHNSKVLVNLGDTVYKGDPIAEVGRNGDYAFLYFEIRKNDVAYNPLFYLPKI